MRWEVINNFYLIVKLDWRQARFKNLLNVQGPQSSQDSPFLGEFPDAKQSQFKHACGEILQAGRWRPFTPFVCLVCTRVGSQLLLSLTVFCVQSPDIFTETTDVEQGACISLINSAVKAEQTFLKTSPVEQRREASGDSTPLSPAVHQTIIASEITSYLADPSIAKAGVGGC